MEENDYLYVISIIYDLKPTEFYIYFYVIIIIIHIIIVFSVFYGFWLGFVVFAADIRKKPQ